MNRLLKFRAWDGNQIRYDVTGFEHGSGNEMAGIFLNGDFYRIEQVDLTKRYNQAEVMQFTGLLDKHGKEIYEGDVMEIHKGMLVVIGWNEETAAFCVIYNGKKSDHLYAAEYSEIVGNIYEHSDLLNSNE